MNSVHLQANIFTPPFSVLLKSLKQITHLNRIKSK